MKEEKPAFATLLFVNIDCGFKLWAMVVGFVGCSDTISNQITTLWMPIIMTMIKNTEKYSYKLIYSGRLQQNI